MIKKLSLLIRGVQDKRAEENFRKIEQYINRSLLNKLNSLESGGDGGFSIGDYRYSDLTEAQFQEINGYTWVLANGQNCEGTDYGALTGKNNVPNLTQNGGLFMRMATTSNAVGTVQGDSTAMPNNPFSTANDGAHTHRANNSSSGGNSTSYMYGPGSGTSNGVYTTISSSTSNHSHAIIGGDTETRPVNIAVNVFIKVNW